MSENFSDITLECTGSQAISLGQLKGKRVVLYFYPKDNTPGCTREGQDFRDLHDRFSALNTVVLGASGDTLTKHEKFKTQHNFPFELLVDSEHKLAEALGVIAQKRMFSNTFLGIVRSTFVFDTDGKLIKEWRKVKVPGHAQAVLNFIESLEKK